MRARWPLANLPLKTRGFVFVGVGLAPLAAVFLDGDVGARIVVWRLCSLRLWFSSWAEQGFEPQRDDHEQPTGEIRWDDW